MEINIKIIHKTIITQCYFSFIMFEIIAKIPNGMKNTKTAKDK